MKKIFKIIIFIFAVLSAVLLFYFFVGSAPVQKNITWGVNFSQMQAEILKLDWKETYLAILDDLKAKNIKLHTQWDWVEGERGAYFFDDIDWQINQAEIRNVKIIYVLGMKTGRWPECHLPEWAKTLSKEQQQAELLKYIKEVVLRYKDSKAIDYWQVENEPLFKFGVCPSWYYKSQNFIKAEVALVKSLDPSRQIIISDSGNLSFWFDAVKIGDILGITIYKKYWVSMGNNFGFYSDYFLPPEIWLRRIEIINKFFNKKVIGIELQAEPWASKPLMEAPIEEQIKSMNIEQFEKNVQYAKETGLDEFYFWGVEWWYWMKTKQNQSEIWNEAKKLF